MKNKIFSLTILFFILQSVVLAQELKLKFGSTANLGLLPLIALHEGLFTKNNLTVDYAKFQTGKMTMDALISNQIEVGTLVDSNIAFVNFSDNPVKVIALISQKLDDAIYFKKNNSITNPADLIGKRIGYVPATTSHVFLTKFLAHNKISWDQIKPVIIQPPAMDAALREQFVDAVSIWQPWGTNILKENYGTFINSKDIYNSNILLATTAKVVKEKPEAIVKLIDSLEEASTFYYQNQSKNYPYLAKELGTSEEQITKILKSFTLKVQDPNLALPQIQELGKWIAATQENFKDQKVPDYNKAFDINLF